MWWNTGKNNDILLFWDGKKGGTMWGKKFWGKEIWWIAAGTFLMAVAVNLVYEPLEMVPGGISGAAILIQKLTERWIPGGIPVWSLNFILNIPIFIWGITVKGKNFIWKSILANMLFSLSMFILPVSPVEKEDYLLAAVVGGGLTGTGIGLVFAAGYSTGGTDLLSSILQKYIPYYSVAGILFVLDAVIILAGALTFGIDRAIYAGIAVYFSSRIMDAILSGLRVGKQVFIISDSSREISQLIMDQLGRGVTELEGRGMFSGREKPVLLCVVGRRQIAKLLKIVRGADSAAFVIISEAREVLGEGFSEMVS